MSDLHPLPEPTIIGVAGFADDGIGYTADQMRAYALESRKAAGDTRAAFEAWITQDGLWPQAARLNSDGSAYAMLSTHTAWGVWQAAAAALRN